MYDYLETAVRQYLAGEIDRLTLAMEMASFDWDDTSPAARQWHPLIGRLELLAHEVGEGLRDEAELRDAARDALTTQSGASGITLASGWESEPMIATFSIAAMSGADPATLEKHTLEIVAGTR